MDQLTNSLESEKCKAAEMRRELDLLRGARQQAMLLKQRVQDQDEQLSLVTGQRDRAQRDCTAQRESAELAAHERDAAQASVAQLHAEGERMAARLQDVGKLFEETDGKLQHLKPQHDYVLSRMKQLILQEAVSQLLSLLTLFPGVMISTNGIKTEP